MFEGTISETGFNKAAKSGDLRPIEWSTLTARLDAARELRGVIASHRRNSPSASAGNFSLFSAARGKVLNETETGVNPEALADGKCSGPKVPDTAIETQSGDRE